MSLKFKLISCFSLISMFLLVVGGIGYYSLNSVAAVFGEIANRSLPNTINLSDMRVSAMAFARNVTFLALPNLPDEAVKAAEGRIERRLETFEKADKGYLEVEFLPGEEVVYNKMKKSWGRVREVGDNVIKLSKSGEAKDRAAANSLVIKELEVAMDEYNLDIASLAKFHVEAAKAAKEKAETAVSVSERITFGTVIAGFLCAIFSGLFLARQLSSALIQLSNRLGEGATEVGSASQQLSSSSEELSSSATEQASALQETTASVEEISAMVTKNAENADQSRDLSAQSRTAAEEGKRIIAQMVQATADIAENNSRIMIQVEESNKEIAGITAVINEIANKTKVINEIVFQTKLLSFNASVEAARAGENGKGFAVVAEEVGSLAQMSGNAAKEITDLLESSARKVNEIVESSASKISALTTEAKEKVDLGTQITQRCDEVLGEIVKNVGDVDRMVGEISTASREQSQGVSEIGKAMTQLDQTTQQNSAVSQQAAAASSQLAAQAEALRMVVGQLNQLIKGGGGEEVSAEVTTIRRRSTAVSKAA